MALIGLLLFWPAGTWHYWQAWLLLALLFVPMTCMGIWLLISMPDLLAKRLNNKEKEQTQKHVVALSGLMFIGGFVLCGLDHRFAWSSLPLWASVIASVLFRLILIIFLISKIAGKAKERAKNEVLAEKREGSERIYR